MNKAQVVNEISGKVGCSNRDSKVRKGSNEAT